MSSISGTILVIKLSSLGDVVHCLHAVRELKRQTGARIVWAVDHGIAPALADHPAVDELLLFPRDIYQSRRGSPIAVLRDLRKLACQVRQERFDLAVDFQGRGRSYLLLQLCRARRKIGRGRFPWLRESIPHVSSPRRHAAEACLEVLDRLGLDRGQTGMPEYPVTGQSVDRLRRQFDELGIQTPYAALIPGTTWPSKCWPPAYWAVVAERLAQCGLQVLLIGGERDRVVADELLHHVKHPSNIRSLAGMISLRDLGALFVHSTVTVSGDTGTMHLAIAAGARVLALYGPTDPETTGPWPPSSARVIQAPDCPMCRKPRCRHRCLRKLMPDAVIQALTEILAQASDPGPAMTLKGLSPR
jgi:heptosyltransferase I